MSKQKICKVSHSLSCFLYACKLIDFVGFLSHIMFAFFPCHYYEVWWLLLMSNVLIIKSKFVVSDRWNLFWIWIIFIIKKNGCNVNVWKFSGFVAHVWFPMCWFVLRSYILSSYLVHVIQYARLLESSSFALYICEFMTITTGSLIFMHFFFPFMILVVLDKKWL